MKQRNPYRGMRPEDLEQLGLREIRELSDKIREAANSLKKAGDFGPQVRGRLDEVSDRAKRIKRGAGRRLQEVS